MDYKLEKLKEILEKEFDVICDGTRKGKTCGHKVKFEDGWTHDYILVKFYDTGEVKPFYFPDAFRVHLKAVDPKIQTIINSLFSPLYTTPRRLIFGANVGTNSQDGYVKLCNLFGWDKSKKGCFGRQSTLMYALKCTPENYSVWFIPHNNHIELFSENYSWFNMVRENSIETIWFNNKSLYLSNDHTDRITFVKTKDGYVFYGIYQYKESVEKEINHKLRKVQVFKRISTEYSNY